MHCLAAAPGKFRVLAFKSVTAKLSFDFFRLLAESGKSLCVCGYDSSFRAYKKNRAGEAIKVVLQ